MRFKDKVAIVTGSSIRIGEAISLTFGREGASVVLTARSAEKLRAHAEKIRASGGRALPVKTDISHLGDVEEMVRRTLQEFGQVDILVNNAAFCVSFISGKWSVQASSSCSDTMTQVKFGKLKNGGAS